MTDINASLKKTINNEPGPQYKEKNKAEFNFAEGEDGVPYSYDKKVESRLTAIEDKLDSVIENGSVNTQLAGSNVEDGLSVKSIGSNAVFTHTTEEIPVGSSHRVRINSIVGSEINEFGSYIIAATNYDFNQTYFSFRHQERIDGVTGYSKLLDIGIMADKESKYFKTTDKIEFVGNLVTVDIFNHDESPQKFNIMIKVSKG